MPSNGSLKETIEQQYAPTEDDAFISEACVERTDSSHCNTYVCTQVCQGC